mgnify:CR=1 FL=1
MSFNLVVKSSNLTKSSHYNTYQHKLYRLIKFLKEERGIGYRRISHILTEKGLGYKKISNWFNERNIKTPRGCEFKGNYVFSILKKGRVREDRLNRESKWKIEKVKITI